MSEPTKITAGMGATWTRYLSEYPTADYTLTYAFRPIDGSGPALTFDAAADGVASHKLTLTPAQSATLDPITYHVTGYVTDDATAGVTTRDIVFSGVIEVAPDPSTATGGDLRSFARQMVDALRAGLKKLAAGTTNQITIQGKSWTHRSLAEMRAELNRWEEIVRTEDDAARSSSQGPRKNVFIRFNPTT